jgi:polysaccharide deacetylase family protein (PEP-CTERM system associated)
MRAAFGASSVTAPESTSIAPRFAMSVDVEDYFQVWAFSRVIQRKSWDGFPLRVEASTRRALDLFERHNAKATFFTLGWVAERAPSLIREIVARGHEIASHGYDHAKVFDQSEAEFREDAGRAKKLIEDVAGVEVTGYRAPGFSLNRKTPWAHETLADLGYRYSSSSHPIAHDHYGDPTAPQTPHRPLAGRDFSEAPVATTELLGKRVSCAGGGWFRAMPYGVSRMLIEKARASLNGPIIFYFHPWELDPGQPRIRSAPLKSKVRHYLNLAGAEKKLSRLLADYSWRRIDDALGLRDMKAAA